MVNKILEKRREQMFPKLTPAQMARLEAHGRRVETRAGEVLLELGARPRNIFIVLAGSLEILLHATIGGESVYLLTSGDFSGEMSTLKGSVSLARIRVREGGAVAALDTDKLREIVQTDAELSELLMRAFILRRVALISDENPDVMLLGSRHSADTLRLREFLTRNGYPHANLEVESDAEVQALFDRFHIGLEDIPVVICRGDQIFRNPSNAAIAESLGINPLLDDTRVHDLVIVGAGPAGLGAAVYAASEGLDVRMLEAIAPGGQAGTSSRIENYLGFPTGISGQALAGRALSQAQKFGANLSVATAAVSLNCTTSPYRVLLTDGNLVSASVVLVTTGAQYRLLDIENIGRFMGTGVYYAATHLEATLCQGEEVIVVGGGNSAGQAAVFLASSSRRVHILVRSSGLADSMSRYLIRRIEESPNINLHTHTQLTALHGTDRLERVAWQSGGETEQQWHDVSHVFLMTGASPNTQWLQGCVALDTGGFVKTGADLSSDDLAATRWPLRRSPYLLETSLPGVFAAGDVRCGSVKRIASAVGEGAMCVQFVHRALGELSVSAQERVAVPG
ncbi:MAG: cyclic nucleotide-binding domain-containing protein [Gammaproteobacteria bacterium]|nr:MAG: cyclic nucleotide-binding domain-containing protein [Gammaproteobacteria bacterium]